MKKIITLALLLAAFTINAQVTNVGSGRYLIANEYDVDSLGGTDTSFKFRVESGISAFSIQVIVVDTIEGALLGAYLEASQDGLSWTALADSLSIDTVAYPLGKYFVGERFPYTLGRLRITSNGATDGIIKSYWYGY